MPGGIGHEGEGSLGAGSSAQAPSMDSYEQRYGIQPWSPRSLAMFRAAIALSLAAGGTGAVDFARTWNTPNDIRDAVNAEYPKPGKEELEVAMAAVNAERVAIEQDLHTFDYGDIHKRTEPTNITLYDATEIMRQNLAHEKAFAKAWDESGIGWRRLGQMFSMFLGTIAGTFGVMGYRERRPKRRRG